jgi:hypothetical protein
VEVIKNYIEVIAEFVYCTKNKIRNRSREIGKKNIE